MSSSNLQVLRCMSISGTEKWDHRFAVTWTVGSLVSGCLMDSSVFMITLELTVDGLPTRFNDFLVECGSTSIELVFKSEMPSCVCVF